MQHHPARARANRGVSPSAISQAERGRRGLSVDTLLTLADRLGMTLDELLQGSHSPGYRLGRRDHPRTQGEETILPLLDDPRAGLHVYLVALPPGGVAEASVAHKGRGVPSRGDGPCAGDPRQRAHAAAAG